MSAKGAARHWKNRFEHQYIVSAGWLRASAAGGVRIGTGGSRQNVHLQA
jgi:hypothetical protein